MLDSYANSYLLSRYYYILTSKNSPLAFIFLDVTFDTWSKISIYAYPLHL